MSRLTWQKSSYSNAAVNCVNIAVAPGGTVCLRESDDPEVILSTTREGLAGLVAAIKRR
ncbi:MULTISPECIES: DUF397 domain-containing protein [Streptomyces]|uniref:DUF397 domain-containing protein n=3 Tax=Streptomyces TaxID=1883 RepID=A0A8A1UV52_STRR1|nr:MULTISPECIES: DUF397 domain-containing protein [Streptomyces]MYT43326.1 DUF397 domain-containing protein [Streptomyces sp. SID5471]QDA04254.1 DUF397 domain-containing protein [Streptomyces rimosus]QEV75538.1 DUF397 domain-containing protein [Streptomyces rimosus]QGY67526.1 DUF397 domain-containing protein [Streptomyces rimosus R6-500]QST83718.1 DUF397 domain-containing protein [Streptomyces rimosus subsp. rimosus ATCC 10970]